MEPRPTPMTLAPAIDSCSTVPISTAQTTSGDATSNSEPGIEATRWTFAEPEYEVSISTPLTVQYVPVQQFTAPLMLPMVPILLPSTPPMMHLPPYATHPFFFLPFMRLESYGHQEIKQVDLVSHPGPSQHILNEQNEQPQSTSTPSAVTAASNESPTVREQEVIGILDTEEANSTPRSFRTRKFQCEGCTKRFTYKSDFRRHLRIVHRNEGPFMCERCGEKFMREFCLPNHTRSHHRVRPYECKLCSRKFIRTASLGHHLAVQHRITGSR